MPRRNLAVILAMAVLVLAALVVGLTAPVPDKDYLLLKQIAEVLGRIDRDYVRALSDEERAELIENMIDGGLRRLDDHSEYMNFDRSEQFNKSTKGQFPGIGVRIVADPVSGFLKIENLIPGAPAYEAGLASGDLITHVEGHSTAGFMPEDGVKFIQGAAGTPVTLTTRREGRVPPDQDVVVTRGTIEDNPITGVRRRTDDPTRWDFMLDPDAKIGYVRLESFSSVATNELITAIKQLHEQGARGLILDLRDDPGGLLPQAISVADLFLPEGARIVSTKNRSGTEMEFNAQGPEKGLEFLDQWPLAVLMNRQSASASEIVAAALQDHGRAVLIGERSYGKGSVQKLFNLPGPPKASLKITTETYWRPSGKNIHRERKAKETDEWGVKPNPGFEISLSDDDRLRWLRYKKDREHVPGKPGLTPPPKAPEPKEGKDKPFEDRALLKAVEYLKSKLAGVGALRQPPPADAVPA